MAISLGVSACDICSMYMNVGMNDYKSSFGISYRSQFFKATIWEEMVEENPYKHFGEDDLPNLIDKTVYEQYDTYEFRAHYCINSDWSIFGALPFKQGVQYIEDQKSIDVYGVSDPTIMVRYRLLASKNDCESNYKHKTTIGGGVKFPLGSTSKQYNGEYVINDMQMGTGSYDFVISGEHISMFKNVGLSANFIYNLKTANSSAYRFGNSVSSQVFLFYNFDNSKREIRPVVGLYTEADAEDYQSNEVVLSTESTRKFINFGLEFTMKGFSIYGNYQKNFFNAYSGIQLEAKYRIVTGIKYYLK